jgi:hypothetical protein
MLLLWALALLLLGIWLGVPVRRWLSRLVAGTWRPGAGTAGLACIAAGLFAGVRGAAMAGLVLAAVGLVLVFAARQRGELRFGFRRTRPSDASAAGMSRKDAAAILGVAEDADPATVREAYLRQIRRAHPDAGGTPGLAAQLNRARDVLGAG